MWGAVQVKAWARHQGINDAAGNTFNSFALTNMVLLHLQSLSPQVMPPLALLLPKDLLGGGGEVADGARNMQRGPVQTLAPQSLSNLPDGAVERISEAADEYATTCAALRRFGADNPAHTAELFAGFVVRFMVVSRAWGGASGAGVAACSYEGALGPTPFSRDYAALVPDPFDSQDNTARSLGPWADAPTMRRVCRAFERTAKQLEALPDAAAVHAFVAAAFGPELADAVEGGGRDPRRCAAAQPPSERRKKGSPKGQGSEGSGPSRRQRRPPRQRAPRPGAPTGGRRGDPGKGARGAPQRGESRGEGRPTAAAQRPRKSVQPCAVHMVARLWRPDTRQQVRGLHCRVSLRPRRCAPAMRIVGCSAMRPRTLTGHRKLVSRGRPPLRGVAFSVLSAQLLCGLFDATLCALGPLHAAGLAGMLCVATIHGQAGLPGLPGGHGGRTEAAAARAGGHWRPACMGRRRLRGPPAAPRGSCVAAWPCVGENGCVWSVGGAGGAGLGCISYELKRRRGTHAVACTHGCGPGRVRAAGVGGVGRCGHGGRPDKLLRSCHVLCRFGIHDPRLRRPRLPTRLPGPRGHGAPHVRSHGRHV